MKAFLLTFALIASSALALDLSFLPFSSVGKHSPLIPVPNLDLSKYGGQWYEIARLPYLFELECYCTVANYTLNSDATIGVRNACNWGSATGKVASIKGKAMADDPINGTVTTGKLTVEFFGFIKAPYYVIDLDDNYQWALVGSPCRSYLWILARTTTIDNDLYDQLVDKAISFEFNVANFVRVYQGDGCGARDNLISE
jgi:apolipoprotein D and lipocalin family protein